MSASTVFSFVLALALNLLFVPLLRLLCWRWRLLDIPGPLKIHTKPIPRLGGVAVAVALCLATVFSPFQRAGAAWHFFAALGLIWAAALADDLRGSSIPFRLIAQLAAGVILWHGGWRFPAPGIGLLSLTATCIFVAAFVNAFNFLDGADGVAAGVAGIIALGYLALPGAVHSQTAAVAAGLAGACLGFLGFNFPRASIFLGDSGSTVLGFAIAFLGLDFYGTGVAGGPPMLFPIVAAGLPLLDAALALARRARLRRSPFRGDRAHFYDLLLARGVSPRHVALTCYGITGGFIVVGHLSMHWSALPSYVLAASSIGLLLFAAVRLGALRSGDDDELSRVRSEVC